MKMLKEFKEFAVRGNVIDLAVAVIIGAAFGAIVTSLVNDILMPPIGLILQGVNFTDLTWTLKPGDTPETAVAIRYGIFLQKVISFVIIAVTIFFMVKALNRLKNKAEDTSNQEVPTPKDIQLLTEIRDLLKR